MRVTLYDLWKDNVTPIEGKPDEIKAKLKQMVPWLHDYHHASLEELIEDLDASQAYSVEIEQPQEHTDVDTMMKNPLRTERLMALKMPGVTSEHLLQAMQDPDHGIAEEALMHPKVDSDVLRAALAHPRAAVRMLALAHPGIEKRHLDQAIYDTDEDVLEQLVQHPHLTEEHIRDLVMNSKASVGIKAMAVKRNDCMDLDAPSMFDRIWEEAANEQGQAPVPEVVRHPGYEDDAQVGGFQKSLSTWLRKGAMQRLAPFNPQRDVDRPDVPEEASLARWQGPDREQEDRDAAYMAPGSARTRALHKLSAATSVRRNPDDGEREFLLHRGMSPEEHESVINPANITHPDVVRGTVPPAGFVNHDRSSSWTPKFSLARNFASDYANEGVGPRANEAKVRHGVVSAWIPESAISIIPQQYGKLDPRAYEAEDENYKLPKGPNEYRGEHEVIVNPDHNSRIATPEEVKAQNYKSVSTLHGRINVAGKDEPYGAGEPKFLRERYEQAGLIHKSEVNYERNLDDEYTPNNELAEDMQGFRADNHPAFLAAMFLVNGKPLDSKEIRSHLWHEDGDCERAALRAYGLDPTEKNIRSLKAVMKLREMKKSDPFDKVSEPEPKTLVPALPEGKDAAEAVLRAYKSGDVNPIQLKGKHSEGALIAKDPETNKAWLLKPGSGPLSPAKGVAEETASQSQREACFWHVAEKLGLGDSIPRCDLLMVDGAPVAAISMLSPEYRNMEKASKQNQTDVLWALNRYRQSGMLHKWAVLDYLLGNVDRHSNNMMMNHDRAPRIFLIDHGSAFAGEAFDPAHDKDTFIPYYLRAWTGRSFNKLPPEQKLRYMPRVSPAVAEELSKWLNGIHSDTLSAIMHRYGIDPKPVLERLAVLKGKSESVDEAIDRLWVTV